MIGRRFFQAPARYLLLAALFYAPWAYGSTRPYLVALLDDSLLLCFALHLIGLALERRLPRYPLFPMGCLVLLLLQASWMCFNARSLLDDSFWEFVTLIQPFPQWPGSWNLEASLLTLKTLGAMASAFAVASDMMPNPIWKARLWRIIGIAGCSIIFYGLLQKGFGPHSALAMYHGKNVDPTFFGPYRYHANAGAYLNIIWPVLLALLLLSWRRHNAHLARAIWLCALVAGLAACFVNTSKAASVITLLMLIIALFSFATFAQNNLIRSNWFSRSLVVFFTAGFIGILIYGGITNQLRGRWIELLYSEHTSTADAGSRLLVYDACLRILPEAGWFGFGPGTFSSVFPFHTLYLGDKITGFWVYAHEDYLQTVVEYGYWGAAIWALLFFGSICVASYRGLNSSVRTHDRIVYRATALALIGLALHSLIDFPLQVASIQLYVAILFAYAWRKPDDTKRVIDSAS